MFKKKLIKKFFLRLISYFFRNLEKISSDKIAIKLRNLRNRISKYNYFFGFSKSKNLFYISDEYNKHFFGNRKRGFSLYELGLNYRASQLADSYLIKIIKFERDDLVIDCGANYADLWLYLVKYINPDCYITFEPGFEEYLSICQNAPNGKHNNFGLGDKNEDNFFYTNHKDADSSFIKPHNFSEIVLAKIYKLDTYIKENSIKKVKLLKLEAEGFEPEILKGSYEAIKIIVYIAIDGGFERGEKKEETFTTQTNFLIQNNFEIIGINYEWKRGLFLNKKYIAE